MKLRELQESFKHYTVKHKRTGKTYKVTAMHDKSAIDKAKVQHGGTASRYTGTSIDDFEIVENYKAGDRAFGINPDKFKHGLKVYVKKKDGVQQYISVKDDKVTGTFDNLIDLKKHQEEILNTKVNEDFITEEQFDEAAGKKDACYHKVKSRYKVWPSAYASGALVKCRKVGAKNWGNKSKK